MKRVYYPLLLLSLLFSQSSAAQGLCHASFYIDSIASKPSYDGKCVLNINEKITNNVIPLHPAALPGGLYFVFGYRWKQFSCPEIY